MMRGTNKLLKGLTASRLLVAGGIVAVLACIATLTWAAISQILLGQVSGPGPAAGPCTNISFQELDTLTTSVKLRSNHILIDPTDTFIYLSAGSGTTYQIVKVDLSTFTQVGVLTLSSPTVNTAMAGFSMDSTGSFIVSMTQGSSGFNILWKVFLSVFLEGANITVGGNPRNSQIDDSSIEVITLAGGGGGQDQLIPINLTTLTQGAHVDFTPAVNENNIYNAQTGLPSGGALEIGQLVYRRVSGSTIVSENVLTDTSQEYDLKADTNNAYSAGHSTITTRGHVIKYALSTNFEAARIQTSLPAPSSGVGVLVDSGGDRGFVEVTDTLAVPTYVRMYKFTPSAMVLGTFASLTFTTETDPITLNAVLGKAVYDSSRNAAYAITGRDHVSRVCLG